MFTRNVAVSVLLALSINAQVAGQGFKLQTVLNSAKCLTASSLKNGAAVVIENCGTNATTLNTWFSTPLGPTGFAKALSAGGFSSCLDVTDGPSGVAADGTKLQMWACSTTVIDGAQEFIFAEGSTLEWGGGIVVDGIKVCVDVTDGVTTNGNQLQIWECAGNNSNQKFNMIPV
ncbi:ricin B lectin domain-containing protein [Mycena albidolilacea]|uniref:Ricin B lectin domain-containing protein n=1 Tax=Mycena albidolilacea TaxID=1033008 RepID=A0AAD6ZBL8_9AGAR|nr:ricin B lectin domain-containing protein [Mycena albidolilacea]